MSDESKEMLKILFKSLNYEVISTDMKLNEAVIKLNITNKDVKEIFVNYFGEVLSLSMSGTLGDKKEEEKNKELIKYFEEQCNLDKVKIVSSPVTITLKKENKEWKASFDEKELLNAVFPGVSTIIDSLSNIKK